MCSEKLPRIIVINMARNTERRQTMCERLDRAGLPYEFLDAVNGYELNYEQADYYNGVRRRRYFGRDMTPGEIGCLLSHKKAYEKMVREDIAHAVILEDDVIFEDDIKETLARILDAPLIWDVVRFLSRKKIYKRGFRSVAPLPETRYQFVRLPSTPGGAYGYLLTKKAAQTMLEHMKENWMPIDALQGRVWATGLETMMLYPSPLYPDPQEESTIGGERFNKRVDLQGVARIMYPFTRSWFKLCEGVGKRRAYYSSWLRDKKIYKDNYKKNRSLII